MYILDTNVVSELRKAKSGKADANVIRWVASRPSESFFISAISLLELETGVLMMERRDPEQGLRLREWLERQVIPGFDRRILPLDAQVARRCAALHVPDRCADRDAMIAATAFVHDMAVVTRNTADFMPTGIALVNPWNEAGRPQGRSE